MVVPLLLRSDHRHEYHRRPKKSVYYLFVNLLRMTVALPVYGEVNTKPGVLQSEFN